MARQSAFDIELSIDDLAQLHYDLEEYEPTPDGRRLNVLIYGRDGQYIIEYTAQQDKWVKTLDTVPWQAVIGIEY